MTLFFIVAAAWALPSFFLHNVLHEGSHALVALLTGGRNVRLWPFPSRDGGYFTWAHVTYDGTVSPWFYVAPLVAESVWLSWTLPLMFFLPFGPWTAIFAVECVSSLVDMTTWLLGWWNPTPNDACDAEVTRREFGFSRGVGKALSLLLLPAWALAVLLFVLRVTR